MIRHIARFPTMKVVVFGDIMLDVYEFCYSAKSKPIDYEKKGVRAYSAQTLIKTLGGAGNVAANLATLGVHTHLIGVTGHDGHHLTLQQLAEQHGIRHSFVRDRDRITTIKNRLYLDDVYFLRRDDESNAPIPDSIARTLINEVECELDGTDAVILSDYNKGVFSEPVGQEIIRACHARKIPVIVDFKPPNRRCFVAADIVSPNASEAEWLLPGFNNPDDFETGARRLFEILRCRNLIVTLGKRGICGFDGTAFFHIPANLVEERDAVGCGDTVRAVLAAGYASGLSIAEAAALANDAASLVVQKTGTSTVTREELAAFLER